MSSPEVVHDLTVQGNKVLNKVCIKKVDIVVILPRSKIAYKHIKYSVVQIIVISDQF